MTMVAASTSALCQFPDVRYGQIEFVYLGSFIHQRFKEVVHHRFCASVHGHERRHYDVFDGIGNPVGIGRTECTSDLCAQGRD